MQKDELNILIVEDDQTLGGALKEALSRAGFKASHVSKPDEALALSKIQPIHAAIIDCMLPKMNGRDLAKKLKDETGNRDLPIILMSGIYKDKGFIREALQSTGAVAFLSKPFEIEDLLKTIEQKFEHLFDAPLSPLQALFSKHTSSHKERIKAINDAEEVHGFDLPWIFSALMHPRIKGHLNILSADGEVCGVGFQKGNIIQVNQKDAKSYFGVLMVEYGFISQAELDEVMSATGKTKRVGERLVEANVLSPHAIQIVMAEQQGIRLGATISNTSVKVNFIDSDEMREDAVFGRETFTELMNDWLMSKITLDWLKSFYIPWMRFTIQKGSEYSDTHRCLSIPVVRRVPRLLEVLQEEGLTLEQALAKLTEPEDHVYRAMHALFVTRVLRFDEQKSNTDYETQKNRLKKLNEDLSKQTHFERLGVSSKAKESEIKRAYHELAKILHPDKVSPDAPDEVRELARSAFAKISEANEVLNNPSTKETYLLELEMGRAEAILEAEQLAEQARLFLSKGDIRRGREHLEKAVSLAPPTSEIRLLLMWAKLKAAGIEKNTSALQALSDELSSIPAEDRHNSTYYFVKGLHLKAAGDFDNAQKSLNHAVSITPDFIDARRELSALNAQVASNKPVDILRGDLKDVVGLLFKKKR